jgi:quercetin dioxygenase-like cupin family protein
MRYTLLAIGMLALATSSCTKKPSVAGAQDPVKVDPAHYKVELENDQVRVLRITYGPNEKSVMHSHPAGVAVFLTGGDVKFTFPDGKTEERHLKAGDVGSSPAETHLPENPSDKLLEVILVELKASPSR